LLRTLTTTCPVEKIDEDKKLVVSILTDTILAIAGTIQVNLWKFVEDSKKEKLTQTQWEQRVDDLIIGALETSRETTS